MRDGQGRRPGYSPYRVTHAWIALQLFLGLCTLLSVQDGGTFARFVERHLLLHPEEVFAKGHLWQVLTAPFFDRIGTLLPVAVNGILLYVFGRAVEERLGSVRMLLLLLLGGAASAFGAVPWAELFGDDVVALGATGAVFAVLVYSACLEPDEEVFLLLIFAMRQAWAVLTLVIAWEAFLLFVGETPRAAVVGHLAGAVSGGFAFLVFGRRAVAASPPEPEPVAPRQEAPPEGTPDVRGRVDALLAKISEQGLAALSPEERAFLEAASKRYGADRRVP
jgi:membrane associated rhomboid family serine protease